jgi:hypothetical protein
MRETAKTEVMEARNKTFQRNRVAKAEQHAQEYMDTRETLHKQKRNLALMQHQHTDEIERFLVTNGETFNEWRRVGDRIDDLEKKHAEKQSYRYENRKELAYINEWKPKVNEKYNEWREKFPHAEGINDLIETSAKYYQIHNESDRKAFIFNEVVNQNVQMKQAVQNYNYGKQKLHTLTDYQDSKMRNGKTPTPAPQTINRNAPSTIIGSVQAETSQNIGELARDRPLPEPIMADAVHDDSVQDEALQTVLQTEEEEWDFER